MIFGLSVAAYLMVGLAYMFVVYYLSNDSDFDPAKELPVAGTLVVIWPFGLIVFIASMARTLGRNARKNRQ